MPSQITDVFYANFIQWTREKGNCYSTIKLYCNQLKSALNWASRHGCKLSQTYNVYEVPRYFKSRIALSQDEISHIAHFDVSKVARRPQYRRTLERVRDMFVLLCNLGQRFSDIRRISPENFERNLFRIFFFQIALFNCFEGVKEICFDSKNGPDPSWEPGLLY